MEGDKKNLKQKMMSSGTKRKEAVTFMKENSTLNQDQNLTIFHVKLWNSLCFEVKKINNSYLLNVFFHASEEVYNILVT